MAEKCSCGGREGWQFHSPSSCASKWDCACKVIFHEPGCKHYAPPCPACRCFGCYEDCEPGMRAILADALLNRPGWRQRAEFVTRAALAAATRPSPEAE